MKEDNVTGKDLGTGQHTPDDTSLCHSLDRSEPMQQNSYSLEFSLENLTKAEYDNWISMIEQHGFKLIKPNQSETDKRNATQQTMPQGTTSLSPNNTLIQQNVGEGVTPDRFCEIYTQIYGEEIDNIKQLTYLAFTGGGEELLEFINDFIRLLPKEPDVQVSDTRDDQSGYKLLATPTNQELMKASYPVTKKPWEKPDITFTTNPSKEEINKYGRKSIFR